MVNKRDRTRIVAEALANLVTTGGAAAATAAGVPVLPASLAKGILDGTFKLIISEVINRPDPQQILARIRDDRTSRTIETIRDALVEAMGLKPGFEAPIDELADAVLARQDARDDARFQEALLRLFQAVSGITAALSDIKADTGHIASIKSDTAAMRADLEQLKAVILPISGDCCTATPAASMPYLQTRVEALTAELRALCDSEGQRRWAAINEAMTLRSWQRVFGLSQEMERWLDAQGETLSHEVKGQALLMLADAALIRDSGLPWEARGDTVDAWRILKKAEAVFGSMASAENSQRLLRVRAKLTFIDGDHETARKLLAKTGGPATISLNIAILGEKGLWAKASDLAAEQPELHLRWADDAIVAHIRSEHHDRAEAVLAWAAKQGGNVRKACLLAFARETYSQVTKNGSPATMLGGQPADIAKLRDLLDQINVEFASALRDGPTSGIEAEALELGILFGHALRDKRASQMSADGLARWKPTSAELGRAELRDDIAPIEGLADRYLGEHPDLYLFQLLAAMLLTEVDGQPERALELLQSLLRGTHDEQRKQELGVSILIAAQRCDDKIASDAQSHLEEVFGVTHRLPTMLRAAMLASRNDLIAATAELGKVADEGDYLWVQLAACLAWKRGDWQAAAGHFRKVGQLTCRAEAYGKEAQSWHCADNVPKTIEALELADAIEPNRPNRLHNLAASYHNLGRYPEAATVYARSWDLEPHDERLTLSYASCLALSGTISKAIAILDEYVHASSDSATAEAVMMRAQLLLSMGKPADALDSLLPHWKRLSSDHRYLMQVLQLGYSADREDQAQRAFGQLLEMQRHGQLPKGALQQFTINDMVAMHQGWLKQRHTINQQYLSGRIPWLIASHWIQPSGHCLLFWRMRTQHAVPRDHPDDLAEFSVYATNGFTVGDSGGARHLVRLRPSDSEAIIVADMSALITLYRLGLLDKLGTSFKKILVPVSYKSSWIAEQSRIPHHQPRQIATRRAIVDAVRDGKIAVVTREEAGPSVAILDEYDKPAGQTARTLRILQVARWMAHHGKLAGPDLARVEAREHQPATYAPDEAQELLDSGKLLATAFTLQTVHDWGLLDDLTAGLRVMLEHDDFRRLESELYGQQLCDEAGRWHSQLVQGIDQLPNLEFVGLSARDADGPLHPEIRYGLDATLLAIERNLPLLVDDRYCQQARLAAAGATPQAGFGTDRFIERLADEQIIDAERHADLFLELIRWRYKFCLPTPDVLLTLANRFKNGIPGLHLRCVAGYMQDCMRDLGLFGGPEATEPPTPMALKLFTAWLDLVAEFLVRLWQDIRFTELQAARITKWAARCFLPAWPKNMIAARWRTITRVTIDSLLGRVLAHLLQQPDPRKANRLISRIRRSIGIGVGDMAASAESVYNSVASVLDERDPQVCGSVFLRLHDIIYGHRSSIDWRLLAIAESLDLVSASDDSPTEEFMAAIVNREHAARVDPKVGPYAYVLEGQRAGAVYLPDMLCAARPAVRRAALDNLTEDGKCPKSPGTHAALEAQAVAIQAPPAREWVPAVSFLLPLVQEDFELNMAGFAQARSRRHKEGQAHSWQRLIDPTPESLLTIDRDGWHVLSRPGEEASHLADILKGVSNLAELVVKYDDIVGHLALASPLDLGTQVRAYIELCGDTSAVWPTLEPWLMDKARPSHQYQACQTLLTNMECVPSEKKAVVWEMTSHIAEFLQSTQHDSDDAQVWQLQSELAAHYLRIIELSGYALEENRPVTVSWWAARQLAELLTDGLPAGHLAAQVRKWREDPILRGTLLTRDAWSWLSPQAYSPARFATLYGISPLSIAILLAAGNCATAHGLDAAPEAARQAIRDSFCVALLTSDVRETSREPHRWAWDDSIITSAEGYLSALPTDERTDAASQIIGSVKALNEAQGLKAALHKLPSTDPVDAVFVCSRARLFCYEHGDAAEILIECLRDNQWRSSCASQLHLMGWELLVNGLLFLQARQGLEWAVEVPYAFLRAAETTSADSGRSQFFLMCLVMSSLSGNTAGALKLLQESKELPALRQAIARMRESIDGLRAASKTEIAFRLQGICTFLEQV